MPKRAAAIIAVLYATAALAGDEPVIPKGVRYTKTSDAVNETAMKAIRGVFRADAADRDVLAFFETKTLICGPGLWQQIKSDSAVAALPNGKTIFKVPQLDADGKPTGKEKELQGKLFQSDAEALAFWKAFTKVGEFDDIQIRKLTTDELKIYWAMISFDITEPLFIVEGKSHRVVLQFTSPEKLTVTWIDDLGKPVAKSEK